MDDPYHFNIHGVAWPQGQEVLNIQAVGLLVLSHTGGVLGQALGVDEAIELLAEGRQRDRDVLRVAGHADVFDNIWNNNLKNLVKTYNSDVIRFNLKRIWYF